MSITQVTVYESSGLPPPSISTTTNVPVNDVLVGLFRSASGQSDTGTTTCSDTLNGSYAELGTRYYDAVNEIVIAAFFVQASVPGEPVVSLNVTNGAYGDLILLQFTGFQGKATADNSVFGTYGSDTATTSISMSPIVNGFANELLISQLAPGGVGYSGGVAPSGWTSSASPAQSTLYAVETVANTSNPINGSLSVSTIWNAIVVGIYDLPIALSGYSAASGLGPG